MVKVKEDQLCFSTTSHKHENTENVFANFNKDGLKYIEYNLTPIMDGKIKAELVKALLKKYSLIVKVIGGGWCDFFHTGKKIEETFQSIKIQLNIAEVLDCKSIRLFFGRKKYSGIDQEVFDCIVNNIKYVADMYPDINFYFENHDGASLVPQFCLDIMQKIDRNNVKLNFDPINYEKAGTDSNIAYKMLKNYISHIHLKGLVSGTYCSYGQGDVNLDNIIEDLINSKYKNIFTIEYEGSDNAINNMIMSKKYFFKKWL
jgi:sugar phosphate isomerase/epimerase